MELVRRILVLGCLLTGLLAGCGDDIATNGASTRRMVDESWFAFRAVVAVSDPPCVYDTVPSTDSASCYELGQRFLGPSGVVEAEALGLEIPAACSQTQVGQLCVDTDPPDASSEPPRTVWSVALTLSADALVPVNAEAGQCFERALDWPTGQIAIVIDGAVVSAPVIQQSEFEADKFQISGTSRRPRLASSQLASPEQACGSSHSAGWAPRRRSGSLSQ